MHPAAGGIVGQQLRDVTTLGKYSLKGMPIPWGFQGTQSKIAGATSVLGARLENMQILDLDAHQPTSSNSITGGR